MTCHEAFRIVFEITPAEKDALIHDIQCSREDAMAFCKFLNNSFSYCTNRAIL